MVTLQMGLTAPFWTLLLPIHQDRDPHKPGMAGEGPQSVIVLFYLYVVGIVHKPSAQTHV